MDIVYNGVRNLNIKNVINDNVQYEGYLFTGATVVTVDEGRNIFEDGAILVKEDKIIEVGSTDDLLKKYEHEEGIAKIDSRRKMILPGFIDVHAHAGHTLLTMLGEATPTNWMPMMTEIYHHNTDDEFWYNEGRLAAFTRLSYGVTTGLSVISNCQRVDRFEILKAHSDAYAKLGAREILAVGPSGPPYPRVNHHYLTNGEVLETSKELDELFVNTEDFISKLNHGHGDLIRAFAAPFVLLFSFNQSFMTAADVAVELIDLDRYVMKSIREIARNCNTRIHTEAFGGMIRLAMQAPESERLLGEDVHLQHCTGISLDEAKILADTKTHVSSTASSRQFSNRCPVPELMTMGANVVIASDGTAPSSTFDLIRQTQNMALVHRGFLNDNFYFPAGKLLEMITIDAAKALGWEDEIGSIEAGKKADLVFVDLDKPHLTPNLMPLRKFMGMGTGEDVEATMVNGKFVYHKGDTILEDRRSILDGAEKSARETIKRADMEKFYATSDKFWGTIRRELTSKRFEDKGWK